MTFPYSRVCHQNLPTKLNNSFSLLDTVTYALKVFNQLLPKGIFPLDHLHMHIFTSFNYEKTKANYSRNDKMLAKFILPSSMDAVGMTAAAAANRRWWKTFLSDFNMHITGFCCGHTPQNQQCLLLLLLSFLFALRNGSSSRIPAAASTVPIQTLVCIAIAQV